MNRAQLRMHKLLERFKEDLENKTIGEYFQVPLDITINNDVCDLKCKFSKKKECYVLFIRTFIWNISNYYTG